MKNFKSIIKPIAMLSLIVLVSASCDSAPTDSSSNTSLTGGQSTMKVVTNPPDVVQQQQNQTDQSGQLQQLQNEIDQLKNQKKSENGNVAQQSQLNQDAQITASELSPYLSGIVQVACYGDSPTLGSGSLQYYNSNYYVFTNKHVISSNNCDVTLKTDDSLKGKFAIYNLDVTSPKTYNSNTDFLSLPITTSRLDTGYTLSDFSTAMSGLRHCPDGMPQGSPVQVVGYPVSARTTNSYGYHWTRTVTNGIISGYDTSLQQPLGKLPYSNYFVSAPIDSGNSGGVTISKDSKGICWLGIPTWVNVGNYANQGIVQNIQNITYTP